MKKIFLAVALLLVCQDVFALEVASVHLEQNIAVNNQVLKLNGYGIRKKFFIKVYIGSFYAVKHLATPLDVLQDNGDKLIRMNFVHSRVSKEKIIEAFDDGFAANTRIGGSEETKKFLSFFTADFIKGDTVDIQLGADGTVVVRQNGKTLGTIKSGTLVRGILSIYFGEKPADEGLKEGMLGRES